MGKEKQLKQKAKKENLLTFIIITVIAAVCLIVGGIFETLRFLFFFGGLLVIIALGVYISGVIRIKRSFCPYCGAKYDYESDISWVESSRIDSENQVESIVDFECSCPDCGKETAFSKKFVIMQYDKNKNKWTTFNIRDKAKNYFWKVK